MSKRPKKTCLKCEKDKYLEKDFYLSNSPNHSDSRYPVCKDCLRSNFNANDIDSVHNLLLEMNRPFIYTLWESSIEESMKTNRDLLGIYMKNLNFNFRTLTWKDSEFNNQESSNNNHTNSKNVDIDTSIQNQGIHQQEDKNKEDVLRMLGYDPFESESEEDKKHLYNKLIDFLDESTLEDSFKLPAVIVIVKSFNQIDKIDRALSMITSDVNKIANNTGGVKSLIEAKDKMLRSVLALAKDNGISVNHNNNKSKGAGTVSGIIKQLHEIGIEAAEINLFDIETCEGMKQVADISNRSIMEQLMLNENDFTEMIKEQREMIQQLDQKVIELEEENRLLKIKLKEYEQKHQGGWCQP